jgi:hypothetical protein
MKFDPEHSLYVIRVIHDLLTLYTYTPRQNTAASSHQTPDTSYVSSIHAGTPIVLEHQLCWNNNRAGTVSRYLVFDKAHPTFYRWLALRHPYEIFGLLESSALCAGTLQHDTIISKL